MTEGSLQVRDVVDSDYPELSSWWKDWKWEPVPKIFLPRNGLMVYNGDVNICAAWVYKTDVPICWVENFVSNKSASKAERDTGLDLLLKSVDERATKMGFRVIMTSMKSQIMRKRLLDNGYTGTDQGMSHYVRAL